MASTHATIVVALKVASLPLCSRKVLEIVRLRSCDVKKGGGRGREGGREDRANDED
jgi:hypothetical protein